MKKINIKFSKTKLIILLLAVLLIASTVYAQTTTGGSTLTGQTTGVFNDVLQKLSALLVYFLRLLQKILWPIFMGIGGLLGNDLLFGAGMEERLLQVWTQIRNLVNIGFVVILLGLALYNVTGFAGDEYALKKILPKFAFALIAVNFSFIALKAVLDVTNVLSTAIFAMPASISSSMQITEMYQCDAANPTNLDSCKLKEDDPDTVAKVQNICKLLYGKDTKTFTTNRGNNPTENYICQESGGNYKFTTSGTNFFKKFSSKNAALILALQFMNIVNVDKVSEAATATGGVNIASMTFNLLFSLLLYIVYGAAYITLFIVLLVRMVVLWLVLALSPVWALTFAVPKLKDFLGAEMDKKFVQTAIAPITIAIPMTIGYILLEVLRSVGTGQVGSALEKFDMKAISLEASGISDLQSMIVAFAAVAFIWIGVFKAAEGTYAAGIVSKIKGGLEGAGKTAGKLLKVIPIIPTTEGGRSIKQLGGELKAPIARLEAEHGVGAAGLGGAKVTAGQIAGARTPEQLRELVGRGALTQPNMPPAVLNKLTEWEKKGTGPQQAYAKRVLGNLKNENLLPELQRRRMAPEKSRRIAELIGATTAGYTAPYLGAETPPAGTRPGTAPAAGQPPAEGPVPEGVKANSSFEGAKANGTFDGLDAGVKARVDQWQKKRAEATNIQDPKEKDRQLKSLDAELKTDKQLNAAVTFTKTTEQPISAVQSAVQSAAPSVAIDKTTPEQKKALGDALKNASDALKKGGVNDENKIKNILTDVVTKAGVDPGKLKTDAEIGKYLT